MYGSQTFIVGGSTVNLQLKGDMNYVRISGAGEMKMESGVVYLCPSLLPLEGSGVYLPGTLHDVARATVYNATFTDTVTRKGSTWKINPDHGDAGQYSGEIYFSGFIKGRIPSDNYSVSNAFAPGHVYDSNTSGWVQKEADQQLLDKKTIAEYCPASLFTGRCRLYVQALYGQYLYPNGVRKSAAPNVILNDISAPPSFSVIPPTGGGLVGVLTSTGVYFDSVSGEHWLLNISGDNRTLSAYPLRSSVVGEQWRYLLRAKSNLSDEDRYHLEAYILGSSAPVVSEVQKVEISGDVPSTSWSLGYSWHWNYSGTCADLVENTTYAQDNEELPDSGGSSGVGKYRGMESTHFRLSATLLTEETTEGTRKVWSAISRIISGPVRWSTPAGVVVLTQIMWLGGGLSKVIPRWTIPRDSNATFYAFYVGDTLKLCTVSNLVVPPTTQKIEYSDETYYAYGSGNAVTIGMRNGWLKTYGPVATTYKGSMSCGGESASFHVFGAHYIESAVDNKQATGFDHSDIPFGQGSGVTNDWSATVGYPPYETVFFPYPHPPNSSYGAEVVDLPGTLTFDHTSSLVNESQGSYCIFVPARNDAEAVYLLARTHNIKYKTGRVVTHYQANTGTGITASQYRSTVSWSGPLVHYDYCSIGASTYLSQAPREDTTEETVVFESYKLICNAGTFGVKTSPDHPVLPDLLTFEGISYADFETRTSVGGAVLGDPSKISPFGVDIATGPRMTSFVGWA